MITVSGLSCGYGDRPVLRDLEVEIKNGEIMGVIGPNGSGKTTFLRAVSGILPAWSGSVSVDDREITEFHPKELAKKIAVVSQYMDNSYISVEDYLLLGRIPYYVNFQFFEQEHDWKTVNKYLEITGIEHLRSRRMGELSGGERQLAMIARALCQETDIILLDEPTSHLDILHQSEILSLIRKLKTEGEIAVVAVLHDLNLASEYCDRLIMLDRGTVFSSGPPSEVLTYENIESVYNTLVVVKANPVSGKPHVFLVAKDIAAPDARIIG
jgi:iron complex transport system ATP-binding protein